MFNKRKKNIFTGISGFFLNQYSLVILGLILLLLVSIPLARNISKKYEIDSEVRLLEEEVLGLQKKNLELEKLINEYSETDFVEEIARLNLGLKKEGEEVYVIKKDASVDENKAIVNSEIKFAGDIEESNARKWLRHFLKK